MSELYDIETEGAVLGALLIDSNAGALNALNLLNEGVMYKNENKLVYRAINTLNNQNKSIDILTVTMELKKMGIVELDSYPASFYVSNLTSRIVSSANIEQYSAILYQKYMLRELKKLALTVENQTNEASADSFEIVQSIEAKISELTTFQTSTVKHISQIHKETISEIKEVLKGNKETGIKSGIKILDNRTGGWQNGNLIILAARPGMGKSAVALKFATYPALELNIPTAIISLEMEDYEVGGRMFSTETGLNNTAIIQKRLNQYELQHLENSCNNLLNAPIYIDDSPMVNVTQLKNKMRRMHKEFKIKLFVVDYLQLISGNSKNREQEISEISRTLKVIAKELNVPVIALSQLSRKTEEREDKRATLADLRESGAIEQDADLIMFLWRPAYYELYPDGYEYAGSYLRTENLLMIDIAKGRGLETGEVPAAFYGETMHVTNYN